MGAYYCHNCGGENNINCDDCPNCVKKINEEDTNFKMTSDIKILSQAIIELDNRIGIRLEIDRRKQLDEIIYRKS